MDTSWSSTTKDRKVIQSSTEIIFNVLQREVTEGMRKEVTEGIKIPIERVFERVTVATGISTHML